MWRAAPKRACASWRSSATLGRSFRLIIIRFINAFLDPILRSRVKIFAGKSEYWAGNVSHDMHELGWGAIIELWRVLWREPATKLVSSQIYLPKIYPECSGARHVETFLLPCFHHRLCFYLPICSPPLFAKCGKLIMASSVQFLERWRCLSDPKTTDNERAGNYTVLTR